LAAGLAPGLPSVRAAAIAALGPVTSLLLTWVSAEPAADFAALPAAGLLKVFPAADAARGPVLSAPRLLVTIDLHLLS